MKNDIALLKNNDRRELSDIEWIEEFYNFLQGEVPESIHLQRGSAVKLTPQKAFAIIWYLQEHLPVFPDQIERCSVCDTLFDSYAQGHHSELTGKNYCSEGCEPVDLYEREERAEKRKSKKRSK